MLEKDEDTFVKIGIFLGWKKNEGLVFQSGKYFNPFNWLSYK